MNVKTADLKNNLSKYLRRVRERGETIIVCDRDEPIATLSPVVRDEDAEWAKQRAEALARAQKAGLTIDIPLKRPGPAPLMDITPTVAPDGRTDINTIDLVRGGRDW